MSVRELLRRYKDQRILFYSANDERQTKQIDADTGKLQAELWSAVLRAANTQPTPVCVRHERCTQLARRKRHGVSPSQYSGV